MREIVNCDQMEERLRDFAQRVAVDGVTLWLADGEDLVARVNPLEPGMVGGRQPLTRGVISQVYLTGQAIIEEDLANHHAYDPAVDLRTGVACEAMMAAPVEVGDGGGVLSAVRHAGQGAGFCLGDLSELRRVAREIESVAGRGA